MSAPDCPTPDPDKHRNSYVPMARLYVREKVPGAKYGETSKRKWVAVGWVCRSVASYAGVACGHIQLDTVEGSEAAA